MKPSLEDLQWKALDITAPDVGVEVRADKKRGVLHVNVDGLCVLRICRIPFWALEVVPSRADSCEWLPACSREATGAVLHPRNGILLKVCEQCGENARALGWEST